MLFRLLAFRRFPSPRNRLWSSIRLFSEAPRQDPPLYCTIFDRRGQVLNVAAMLDRRQFLKENGLHTRDMRHVDGQSTIVPEILVHKGNILVDMCDLRVLIRSDRVLVFHSKDPGIAERLSILVYDIQSKLSVGHSPYYAQSYEQTALEVVLIHAMANLEAELAQVLGEIRPLLKEFEERVDPQLLRDLLARSKELKKFHRKSLAVRKALDDALDDGPGLLDMYLSDIAQGRVRSDYTEIELLLETYFNQADEIVQSAGLAERDLSTTEDIINILMDANHNSLLLFRLEISILTVGFTLSMFFADLYGMNLNNLLEEAKWGMPTASMLIAGVSLLGTLFNFRRLRAARQVYMPSQSPRDRLLLRRWLETARDGPNPQGR